MKTVSHGRRFDAPWPAVLAEMADFVTLARLSVGGNYQAMEVRVRLSRSVPFEFLTKPEFQNFRAALEGLPRCRVRFEPVDHPYHSLGIEIRR